MSRFRKTLGIILVIVGIIIIGTVIYKKIVTAQKQNQLIDIFEGQITAEHENNNSEEKNELNLDEINGYKPVAIIEIPSIKLKQGVVEGISNDVLKYYLGHYDNTAQPGEIGNFVVAGHRVSDYTDAFINLYKVKKGDEILVKTYTNQYTYVIEDSFIVDPDQIEVLNATEDATITLITCTVGAKQRVVVTGKLIKTEEI